MTNAATYADMTPKQIAAKLSPSQVQSLHYFAGGPLPTARTSAQTDRGLQDRGLLEDCDIFPFQRPTVRGAQVLAALGVTTGVDHCPRGGFAYGDRVEIINPVGLPDAIIAAGIASRPLRIGGFTGQQVLDGQPGAWVEDSSAPRRERVGCAVPLSNLRPYHPTPEQVAAAEVEAYAEDAVRTVDAYDPEVVEQSLAENRANLDRIETALTRSPTEGTPMYTFTYAIQTMDLGRGEADWSTHPPTFTVPTEAADPTEAAREIYEHKRLHFMSSVRGRIAVWTGQRDIPIGTRAPAPDGVWESRR